MIHLLADSAASLQEKMDWAVTLAWLFSLVILGVCLRVYGRLIRRVATGHGKVVTEPFGFPDLLVVVVLGLWLGGLALGGFVNPAAPRAMTNLDIIHSAVLFVVIVSGIAFFLRSRKVSLIRLFGFGEVRPWRAIGLALGLLIAAYPLILFCTALMVQWLGEEAQSQEILEFFSEAARESNLLRIVAAAVVGILVAPLAEEFLFRGYIYGTLRRYGGPFLAMIVSAALFSAIHVNLMALPALFVLALCLTLAYEVTGSLVVPMIMHALFNAVTLIKVFFDAFSA